jgi:hypothetical protein
MTKDEIQALAYKAKIKPMLVDGRWGFTNMEVFVDLLLKEEREQCAKVCDAEFWNATKRDGDAAGVAAGNCADAIRARSNVQQEPQK